MSDAAASPPHIVIVGGGIAGLAAAWYLQQNDADVRYTVLESRARLGGLIQTQHVDDLAIEYGPDAFITRKPWALALARELGLDDDIISVNNLPERIYVLSNGDLVTMPPGVHLLVPTDIPAFLQSSLLSWRGKFRALLDTVIPRKADNADESLAAFVERRLGVEVLDKLADPLLAGVYNADMHRQSILATFPQFREVENQHGSLIRGMRAVRRKKPTTPKTTPALVSFKRGMGQLIDALAAQLTGTVRTEATVASIAADANGGYRVTLDSDETLHADGIIVATPANVAGDLLAEVASEASAALREIRYAGVGNMSLAYRAEDVPRPLDAYGIVVPSSEGRPIDGMQWSSAKWSGRAPDGTALIRVFFGGPHTRQMLDVDDATLRRTIREQVRDLLGISAEPIFTTLHRWRYAYPQYDVGHIERVGRAEAALPPTIGVAGNAYHGVGVPDTVHMAQRVAQRLAQVVTPSDA